MNNRRIATIIALAIFVLALVAPVFMFADRMSGAVAPKDSARAELAALGQSLNGDHRYDEEAAKTLGKARRNIVNGVESFALGSNGSCWLLTPSASPDPVQTDCA